MVWKNHFYHIRLPPLNVFIFITHVRNCVMGATPINPVVTVNFIIHELKDNWIHGLDEKMCKS